MVKHSWVLSDQIIKRSGDTVYGLYYTQGDEERVFLGLASKPWSFGFSFWPQNRQLWFGELAHKITMAVSWFGPQTQVCYGLSIVS
jgi:hypothetical protein